MAAFQNENLEQRQTGLEDMSYRACEQVKKENEEQIHTRLKEQRRCVKNENEEHTHS